MGVFNYDILTSNLPKKVVYKLHSMSTLRSSRGTETFEVNAPLNSIGEKPRLRTQSG